MSKYRMLSTGYDITNMLYNTGTLQTLDKNLIEETVNVTLPGNYEMRLEIESYEKIDGTLIQTDTIDVGPEVGDSLLITHGVETFLVFSQQEVDTYNVVEFWIWLK